LGVNVGYTQTAGRSSTRRGGKAITRSLERIKDFRLRNGQLSWHHAASLAPLQVVHLRVFLPHSPRLRHTVRHSQGPSSLTEPLRPSSSSVPFAEKQRAELSGDGL